ncbi:right-handed parallel beta-helix repeat-containing protein [Schlesneria sp.]|uniref:right-handed parallel beta-helix repeat-containing protein n=1 Tax=Schlesneria sp. TaxID=2762018 RepID=UPI002EEF2600
MNTVRWNVWLKFGMLTILAIRQMSSEVVSAEISVADYPSIQAAIDANPGGEIHLPAGDHRVDATVRISGSGTCLKGSGRIVMTNPARHILEIEHARRVRVVGITLTRSEGKLDTEHPALLVSDGDDITIDQVSIIDNRARTSAIRFSEVRNGRILNCDVRNYMTIAIDDRTANAELLGYAFRCIDGTGIAIDRCQGTLIQGNTIIETQYRPTPEIKAQHQLGKFTKKNPTKGLLISQEAWDAEYVNNWHQGSALIVTGPAQSKMTRILGNHIENAAQGIDIHSDHVIISNNVVHNSFIGTKAMHGSRNVLITGNQFSQCVLWAIGLMSGSGAYPGTASENGNPAIAANVDGGSLITDNVISQFGYGDSYWMWKDSSRAVFRFDRGQEPTDPPLRDVLIQGNIISNPDPDELPERVDETTESPRYHYAVRIEHGSETSPRGLHFGTNVFPAGSRGVSNVELSKP